MPPPLYLPPKPAIIRVWDKRPAQELLKSTPRRASFPPGMFPAGMLGSTALPTTAEFASANSLTTGPTNTVTKTAQGLGTAGATRDCYIWINSTNAGGSASGAFVDSVTIGGISATSVYTQNSIGSSIATESLWWAAVPTGTTGTIVITRSTGTGFLALLWVMFAVHDVLLSNTPTITVSTLANPSTASVTAADQGVVLCYAGAPAASSSGFTWTNATKVADQVAGVSSTSRISGALISNSVAGSVSITANAGASTQFYAAVIR